MNHRKSKTMRRIEKRKQSKHISGLSILGLIIFIFFLSGYLYMYSNVSKQQKVAIVEENQVFFNSPSFEKFVTVVMPSVVNPSEHGKRLNAVTDTWGPSAKAIFVVHDVNEIPTNNIPPVTDNNGEDNTTSTYPKYLLIPESIPIDSGVERLNYVVRQITEKINPDFAYYVNDHTFVITENLDAFLLDQNPQENFYAGHALQNAQGLSFNSGASGYILSRLTSKTLIQKWDEEDPSCVVTGTGQHSNWLKGNPGLLTARCLDSFGVKAFDTRDPDDFSHVFHAYGIVRTVTGNIDNWYIQKHQNFNNNDENPKFSHFKPNYEILQKGSMCCSPFTVSFHYVEYPEARALFLIRQKMREKPLFRDEVEKLIIEHWPDGKEKGKIGGYARELPDRKNDPYWDELVDLLIKITRFQNNYY